MEVKILPDGRMTRKNAALYIGCSIESLRRYENEGIGPKRTKIVWTVYYFKEDIDKWIEKMVKKND